MSEVSDLNFKFITPNILYATREFIASPQECNNNIGCEYQCNEIAQCLMTSFTINAPIVNLNCSERLSCFLGNVITNITRNADTHIVCTGLQSCEGMTINIEGGNFILDCYGEQSCQEMKIHLRNVVSASITCHTLNTCDEMKIETNSPLNTTLSMRQYSSKIVYNNGYGYEHKKAVNLICGDFDTTFLKLENDTTNEDAKELILRQYDNYFPCQDVKFECDGDGFCLMDIEYTSDPFRNITKFVDSCVYASIQDLTKIQCINENGHCESK